MTNARATLRRLRRAGLSIAPPKSYASNFRSSRHPSATMRPRAMRASFPRRAPHLLLAAVLLALAVFAVPAAQPASADDTPLRRVWGSMRPHDLGGGNVGCSNLVKGSECSDHRIIHATKWRYSYYLEDGTRYSTIWEIDEFYVTKQGALVIKVTNDHGGELPGGWVFSILSPYYPRTPLNTWPHTPPKRFRVSDASWTYVHPEGQRFGKRLTWSNTGLRWTPSITLLAYNVLVPAFGDTFSSLRVHSNNDPAGRPDFTRRESVVDAAYGFRAHLSSGTATAVKVRVRSLHGRATISVGKITYNSDGSKNVTLQELTGGPDGRYPSDGGLSHAIPLGGAGMAHIRVQIVDRYGTGSHLLHVQGGRAGPPSVGGGSPSSGSMGRSGTLGALPRPPEGEHQAPANQQQQPAAPDGPEPWDIQVVPGDGTLTVTWRMGTRPGWEDHEIRHALRWSQETGVWANPRDPRAVGRNDGVATEPGATSYVITGLQNDVATGVFIRSFPGNRNNPDAYRMNEQHESSSPWVRVKGEHTTPNLPPTVAAPITDATIVHENGTHDVALSGVFNDAHGDGLTISARSSNEAVATGAVSADQATLTVTAKARGTTTITVTAIAGNGGSVSDEFTVTVKAAPVVASPIADIDGLAPFGDRTFAWADVFRDPDGDVLTFKASTPDDLVATTAWDENHLHIVGIAEGTVTVTVSATDSDGNRVSDTFTVTVKAAPRVAVAIRDVTIVNESGTQDVSLPGAFTDIASDVLPLSLRARSSNEAVATASISTDASTVEVTAKARGTATITVTADTTTGTGGTVEGTFTVQVKAAPVVAAALTDVSGLEAGSTQDVSLSGVFSDADGDPLTITAASSDPATATVTVASDGSKLTLAGVAEGSATITVTAEDADGNTVSDAFDVSVAAAQQQQQQAQAPQGPYAGLIAQMYEWRNDPERAHEKAHTDRWDRALLAFGETVADASLTAMTTTEAQGYADRGWTRWSDVATALQAIESANQPQQPQTPQQRFAGLIAKMKQYRDDPQWSSNKDHTDRWDRALLAFGETVADASLTPMTAAEAQGFADRGWERWVDVAKALKEIE